MKRVCVAVVVALSSGCFSREAIDRSLQLQTEFEVGCSADRVEISDYRGGMAGSHPTRWRAVACGREYRCAYYANAEHSGMAARTECEETGRSKQATYQKIVVDRLALETGCPKDQVEIQSQADWSRDTETAFRLSACGKPYVCTTAKGRTDCKAALASESPPAAPAAAAAAPAEAVPTPAPAPAAAPSSPARKPLTPKSDSASDVGTTP